MNDILAADEVAAPIPVLRELNEINRHLERLLGELSAYSDANLDLHAIAQQLVGAVERDPDIAFAAILLNQIGGRYAVRHCAEAAIVATLMARALGKVGHHLVTIALGAMTMNVGLMRQIESFHHRDSALSREERALIERHPAESAELLRCAGVNDDAWLDCVLTHHEKADGSGYPEGRLEAAIPDSARLISAADRYCACVSARNYRRSMLPPLALAKLRQEAMSAADLALADLFTAELGNYPPGTLVRLTNGEIGVVSRRDEVHVLRDTSGSPASASMVHLRDTALPEHAIVEALHEDQVRLRFSMKSVWGELANL
jgi:HD-GYP domain-containing protein (c-di-GMP phosphodiesterase class II)